MLKCPFCDRKFITLKYLRYHVQKCHPLNGKCPACGKSFREVVSHLSWGLDDKHKLFYALYARSGKKRNRILMESRDIAVAVLEVDG